MRSEKLTFTYGPIVTHVEGPLLEQEYIKHLLVIDPELPSLFQDGVFPSGLFNYIISGLKNIEAEFEIDIAPEDHGLIVDVDVNILHGITLYDYQVSAIRKALYKKRGIICCPTGGGKGEIGPALAAILEQEIGARTLMVVPGKNSLDQTYHRYKSRGLSSVGRIGDNFHDSDEQHTIGIIDSLYSGVLSQDPSIMNMLHEVDLLMFMETHHLQSKTWSAIGFACPAEYRIGLSATPFKKHLTATTTSDYLMIGITGDVVSVIPDSLLMDRGYMATPNVLFVKIFRPKIFGNYWQNIKTKGIIDNEYRNSCIIKSITHFYNLNMNSLTLVNELAHGDKLCTEVSSVFPNTKVYFYQGSSKLLVYGNGAVEESLTVPISDFSKILKSEHYVLIGSPALNEDADFPAVHALVLGGAGRSYRQAIQRAGRALRAKGGSNIAYIVDFYDYTSPILTNQSKERMEFFIERYKDAKNFKVDIHNDLGSLLAAVV